MKVSKNLIDSVPPELEPALKDGQEFWSGVMRRKRERRGEKERSLARKTVNWLSKLWHVVLPVLDDITNYFLLWDTFDDDQHDLWWICLVALALADADRAHALLYLVVLVITLMFSLLVTGVRWMYYSSYFPSEFEEVMYDDCSFMWKPAEFLSGGQRHTSQNITRLFLDAVTWTVLGPRSRYAHTDLGGEIPVEGAQLAGSDVRIIDVLLEFHPYTWCGQLIFRYPEGLRVPRSERERSRRAMVMVKAVGQTVVVDTLFFTLGLLIISWDDPSLVALLSSVFSVLELVTELQHYINEAEPYLEADEAREGSASGSDRVHECSEPQSRRSSQVTTGQV